MSGRLRSTIENIGNGCPYCAGKVACHDNCLSTMKPELAKQWHPSKNFPLTPMEVTIGSNKNVWWMCDKGHQWRAVVYDRVNGNGCPYCSGRVACADNCLSSINPELAKQWHPIKNILLTPLDVTPGSYKKVWWMCNKGHEWEAAVKDRLVGNGCPYCAGKSVCHDNCLSTLNPELAKQWHPFNNFPLTSMDVTQGSDKKIWWKCDKWP